MAKIESKNCELFINIESLELKLTRQVERIMGFDLNYKKQKRLTKLNDFFVLANRVKEKIVLVQKLALDVLEENVSAKAASKTQGIKVEAIQSEKDLIKFYFVYAKYKKNVEAVEVPEDLTQRIKD